MKKIALIALFLACASMGFAQAIEQDTMEIQLEGFVDFEGPTGDALKRGAPRRAKAEESSTTRQELVRRASLEIGQPPQGIQGGLQNCIPVVVKASEPRKLHARRRAEDSCTGAREGP